MVIDKGGGGEWSRVEDGFVAAASCWSIDQNLVLPELVNREKFRKNEKK